MQLDSALLERIASSLTGGSRPATTEPAATQRREPRLDVDARVTAIPLTERVGVTPFEIALRDLSAGGIGFLHRDRLGLDAQFVVLLPAGGDEVAVLCQVAHYQPVTQHSFATGASFVRVLRRPAAEGPAALPLTQPAPVARRAAS